MEIWNQQFSATNLQVFQQKKIPEILGVRKLDAIVVPRIVLAGDLFHLSKFDPRSSKPASPGPTKIGILACEACQQHLCLLNDVGCGVVDLMTTLESKQLSFPPPQEHEKTCFQLPTWNGGTARYYNINHLINSNRSHEFNGWAIC